ncbi:TetR/AcrR family transcriptional regulator C-terminal domain-containing protein [Longispora albida]|uniref:TetR/AcrR family transcriptional regulator C-terminal domain-containing protein n=1 Tax=Longispora albida TaxID=203523 RepID=UPI00036FF1FF|nr:GntR family transcriptional regulator [Longispora albida]
MPSQPQYLVIAAELRRRITEAGLVPGARVPSVRKVAAEWGVATATAARALAALAQEGLIRAEPRSGMVVAAPAPSPNRAPSAVAARTSPSAQYELTRERVVRAAIELADEEGLPVLTMRGVAARLGVAAMTPYRYVAGKDELVMLMADAAFGERGYPARAPAGWRARAELGARTLWSLYRRHPWLAHLSPITRPLPLPSLAAHAEWIISALEEAGLGPAELCDVHVLLFSYVQGIAIHLEREEQALGTSGLSEDEWMDSQLPALGAITGGGRYPAFGRMLGALAAQDYDLALDDLFELGLRSLLDGLSIRFSQG